MVSDISREQIKNEQVDLEKIPIEEVFEQLKCTREGLSDEEGTKRLEIFAPNKLEEKESKLLKFLGFMSNPLSWVVECAAIMAIVLANGGGKPPDWQDFVGIVVLLIINSTISFIEENIAGNAAAAFMAGLSPKTKVLRGGKWSEQDAAILVPGDLIRVKLGDIIPADTRLLEGDPLKIVRSVTGESLSVTKHPGDEVFSGSTCKQGELEAVVIATGVHTFFGKASHLVDSTNQVGHFQQVLTDIGICSIAVGMVIEIVMYQIQQRKYKEGIDNSLVLLIGGIPIAMPTFLSVTMAIGSHRFVGVLDDRIGITSGANYDNMLMISHNNHTGRWLSSFRAIWGWDNSYVFVGSMKREIDVISATVKREIASLWSQNMSAIPCRFDAHPLNVRVLAGATSGGQVYIWNS